MGRTHYLKLQKEFCDAVYDGDKNFEVRYNDRGFQKGDRIKFVAMDGKEHMDHPIEDLEYAIMYVLSGWGIEYGYVALAIELVC